MTKLTKQLSRLISYKAAVISKHSTALLLCFCSVEVVKVLLEQSEVGGGCWFVSVTASQSVSQCRDPTFLSQ